LELGCGAANLSVYYGEKGYEIYGIDISETAIDWAKERFHKAGLTGEFVLGNVVELAYEDNFFDVMVDAHCLHCIIDEDRAIFLSNVKRTLKENGIFIVMTMCGDPTDPDVIKDFDENSRNQIKNGIAGRHFGTVESILEEVKTAGFKVLDYKVEITDDVVYQDELIIFCR